jgi:hypothetical protein
MVETAARRSCPECGSPLVDNPYPFCESCHQYFPLPEGEASGTPSPSSESAQHAGGIRVICVLWLLYGLVQVGVGIFFLWVRSGYYEPLVTYLGVAQLCVGAAILTAVGGLWLLRLWAWRFAMVLLWIGVVLGVSGLMLRDLRMMVHIMAVPLLIYIYNRRALFSRPREPSV